MVKIATIVGARPQFVKAAAFSRAVKENAGAEEILIHTGQHYDENMSEIFFQEMQIPKPGYHLGIGGCKQGAMTGKMIEKLEELFEEIKPDWVLIFGDTNSTLAGALAAVKMHIRVAHVEAGLRSFNRQMPEEINRILSDHCANLLLTPTTPATEQLLKEGIAKEKIVQVGDVMYDAALYYREHAGAKSRVLEEQNLSPKGYALATIHRAENCDDPERLQEIFAGLAAVAAHLIPVVLPLHPRTRAALIKQGLYEKAKESIRLIDPVGYLEMIALESHAALILTDSGGVQKEAFFFRTPCITLRDETEWIELIDSGCNCLAGAEKAAILAAATKSLQEQDRNWSAPLYGDGTATKKILNELLRQS